MQLIIESPGLQPDNQLQNLIRSKFEHLRKMYDRITKCTVILRKEKNDHKKNCTAEAKLFILHKPLFAREQDENFEAAVQKVVDDLINQLRRFKGGREEIW